MMRNATKFTFDTVFSAGCDTASDAAKSRQRKVFTEAEIDALRANAHAQGTQAGEVLALESIAAGTREAGQALRDALISFTAQMESVRADAAAIAFAIARKVASTAVAEFPVGEVESALRRAMHEAIGEPRIVLHARPEVVEALSAHIAEIAQDEGYEGRVQISGDASLHGADCRIDWRGGGAERTNAAIEAALDELMTRRFANAGGGGQNRSES
jgi:flagellar assembly protein FliH